LTNDYKYTANKLLQTKLIQESAIYTNEVKATPDEVDHMFILIRIFFEELLMLCYKD